MKNLCILFVLVLISSCSLYNHKTHSEYSFKASEMVKERESASILDFQTIEDNLQRSESKANENQISETIEKDIKKSIVAVEPLVNRMAKSKVLKRYKRIAYFNTNESIREHDSKINKNETQKNQSGNGLIVLLVVLGILLLALLIGIIWVFVQIIQGDVFGFG